NPNSVTTGDFNSDGWLDLATANSGGNTVSILPNIIVNIIPDVPVTLSRGKGSSTIFKLTPPAGTTRMVVTTGNGTGDCDLYVSPNLPLTNEEYFDKSTNAGTS
ncbi:MAG: FG-GAP repeat protein, partial [Lentisphaerota bacterium]